jgi:hypothetical protein
MAGSYIGTTHAGGGPRGGSKVRRRRFAWPAGLARGAPARGNVAPWYLKQFGSRPAHKRPRQLEAVA